jgi:tryptophanyl-tRNA synthetase
MVRSFSGIQPTGDIHLGNYLGALRYWVTEQERSQCFFCIVDLHAITQTLDPVELRARTLDTAATLFAIGIDPRKSTLFVQSHVHEHAELAWVLNCLTGFGELRRMTQFKAKARQGPETQASTGLLVYPVLQAADILLYQAQRVLVGEDQRQHLELARDLAERFNHRFGNVFTVPEAVISQVAGRIMDLQDPRKKMSKSSESPRGTLRLTDSPETIRDKVRGAVTDAGREIRASAEKPAITNLLTIYSAVTDQQVGTAQETLAGASYERFKSALADALVERFRPIRERYDQLAANHAGIERMLGEGVSQAGEVARSTLSKAFTLVGFLPRLTSAERGVQD